MISIAWIERLALVVVFLCTLIPIAARTESFGLPLYGIPALGLYLLWAWRSLHSACLNPDRAMAIIPFLIIAILLGSSTFLAEEGAGDQFFVWATGLLLMVYANQNWNVTFDFRFVASISIVLLSLEVLVAIAQIATKSYVGNSVMYFGQSGGVAEEVGLIAGGRVFRPVGTFGLPNLLSIFIVILSAVLVPVVTGSAGFSRFVRAYSTSLLVAGFMILVYSTSRGNIIAMIGLPVLFYLLYAMRTSHFVMSSRRSGMYLLIGFSILLFGSVVLMVGLREAGTSEFLQGLLFRLQGVEESARFRLMQYWSALSALTSYPLIGMGFGQSPLVWEIVELDFPGKEDFAFPPHNAYIVLALEGGVLAGLVYAGSMLWLSLMYPLRQLADDPDHPGFGDACHDGLYLAFLMFAVAGLIYIVPLTRSLWPLGCFLIGLMPALRDRHGGARGTR